MRWKCTLAYDGTSFEGWQSQPGSNTIQDLIEKRLKELFKERIVIHGSGRTDSGVHARGQVFHFDGDWPHGGETLLKALRPGCPESINIYSAEVVDDEFHARFSAVRKRYVYQFHEGLADPFKTRWYWSLGHRKLDVARMNEAAALLVGRYDFSSFTVNPNEVREDSPVRNLSKLEVERSGDQLFLNAEADGFLYRMVRSLAGFLFDVGIGRLGPDDVVEIRDAKERSNLVRTAPPQGLFLDKVIY